MPTVPASELKQTNSPMIQQVRPENVLMALAEMHHQGVLGPQPESKPVARTKSVGPKATKTG